METGSLYNQLKTIVIWVFTTFGSLPDNLRENTLIPFYMCYGMKHYLAEN